MPARLQRALASGLVALSVSGIALYLCSLAFEALMLQQRLGVDDDACRLALGLGPLFMMLFQRPLHSTPWAPRLCVVVGSLILVASVVGFAVSSLARANQRAHGDFTGIGHALLQLLSVFGGVVGTLAILGGVLAAVGQRAGKT